MRKRRWGLLVCVVCLVCATAAGRAESTLSPSPTPGGQLPGERAGAPGPCSFTQNLDFSLCGGCMIGCLGVTTTDNQYVRIFDLDGEHGLRGPTCLESLDYAVDTSEGGVAVTFNVYCTPQGFADESVANGFIDRDILDPGLAYSVAIEHPDAAVQYFTQPLGGCCDADTQDMAVEIATEDCQETGDCFFYPGGNDLFGSDTKPWFLGAPDCGVVDPIAVTPRLILENYPLLMRLNAVCNDEVPAVDGVGFAAMLLLFWGAAAFFLFRR